MEIFFLTLLGWIIITGILIYASIIIFWLIPFHGGLDTGPLEFKKYIWYLPIILFMLFFLKE